MNKCNWTDNVLNKETGKLEIKECQSTNTVKDKENVNDRWFCIDQHIEEVKKIRKIMHKNCINKEKIIIWLNKQIRTCLCDELKEVGKLTAYYKIIEFIENDEFDDNKN